MQEDTLKNSTAFLEIMKLVKKGEGSKLSFIYDELLSLTTERKKQWGALYEPKKGIGGFIGHGNTPREAVENLWKALEKAIKENKI